MKLLNGFNGVNIFCHTALVRDNNEQIIFFLQIFQRFNNSFINNKMLGQVIVIAPFFYQHSVSVKKSRFHGRTLLMESIKFSNSAGFIIRVNTKPKTAPQKCASWLMYCPERFAEK